MIQIRHDYISVDSGPTPSYGGSQMSSASKTMREVGCGVIAALDLLLYLSRFHPGCACSFFDESLADGCIDGREYDLLAQRLSKRFFPMIPKFGINGLMLAGGLDLFFIRYKLPFRAVWRIGERNLYHEIERMLAEDIPVILAVGPNFPLVWKNHKLSFYAARPDGTLAPACGVKAHYVTVTGIDEERLYISSWGRPYCIERREYSDYIRRHSGSIVSNIVNLKHL